MFKIIFLDNFNILQITNKFIYLVLLFTFFFSKLSISESYKPKKQINGSGLAIPRMVSLKNSLTFMRSGPGKEYPIMYELKQKGYPLKIISEFNNWRKVTTKSNIIGWIHTQLLSSFKTGLIVKSTFLKKSPKDKSKSIAKLLPNLLINIKKCQITWCKIEVIKGKSFVGWIKKEFIWGSILK